MTEKKLFCRRCDEVAEVIVVKGEPSVVRCPACGNQADFEKANVLAARHFMQSEVHNVLDRVARKSRSKHTRYVKGDRSNPPPDFIVK